MKPWLDPIPPFLHERAEAALQAGDALGFLSKAPNDDGLQLVLQNAALLLEKGIYENALLEALTGCRLNNAHMPMYILQFLVSLADRKKLRAAGARLPGVGLFELFRGVAGRGPRRRVRGLSWTDSLETARWFAQRGLNAFRLEDPGVYRVVVPASQVLAYISDRREREFLVQLTRGNSPRRIE